jgi:Pilin (bacterial filament)
MGNTQGKYTASVSAANTGTINGTQSSFTLEATMKTAGVNTAITGKTLQLRTADAGKNWICTSAGADPVNTRYLASACR